MAKSLLLYGRDAQIRRLAQEIITDQQSEIQLMQLSLKQHEADSQSSAKIRFKTVAVGRGMDKEPLTTRAGGKPGFDIPVCRKLAEMGEKLARESERRSHRAGCSWVLLISTSRHFAVQ
jgi:hypothetical protein